MIRYLISIWILGSAAVGYADSTMVTPGALSGTWTAVHSPYVVSTGNIMINDGDTLTIMPGVVVKFTGGYQWSVHGVLRALGRSDSLICITADTIANPSGWAGIRFTSARDSNRLSWCIVENVRTDESSPDQFGSVAQWGTGRVTFDNVSFRNNRAGLTAGAYTASNTGGALFSQCHFTANTAGMNGGALYLATLSPHSFVNCNFEDNTAGLGNPSGRNGGAVDSWHGSATFASCSFVRNRCASAGGAVQGNGSMSFSNCVFDSNRAGAHGGAVYLEDNQYTYSLNSCVFRGNIAVIYAGALYVWDCSPTVTNCQFIGNFAGDRGGAICCYRWNGTPHFENCLITQNICNSHGGAFWTATYCQPTFRNCTFSWNSAAEGGGVYSTNHGAPSFSRCTFTNNSATGDGGGLCLNQYSVCTFDSGSIDWNTSAGNGGGLVANGSFFAVTACSLSYNSARNGGGAAIIESCAESSPVSISNSLVKGNHADSSGGGFFVDGAACPNLERLLILDNWAGSAGGGLACFSDAHPFLNRCDILRNQAPSGAGVYAYASSPGLSTTIIAANLGAGIGLRSSASSRIAYCDLYNNTLGNFDGDFLPVDLGMISHINAVGHPCDPYCNVFLNPLLPDSASGNFHLGASSPCIDAGDTVLNCDPDLTIPDIGAVSVWGDAAAFAPRELLIADSTQTMVVLRWRRPSRLCVHAPIQYQVWSTADGDSTIEHFAATTDTVAVDSTTLFGNRYNHHQSYYVTWRQISQ